MASAYQTTEKHAAAVKAMSKSKRSATSGNKNVVTGKKGQRAAGDQKPLVKKALKGPY